MSAFSLFFLFSQLTALITVTSRFSTLVECWFGFVSIRVCGMFAHSVEILLIRISKSVQLKIRYRSVGQSVHMCQYPTDPDFLISFKCYGNSTYKSCSRMACAAFPNAFLASFWSSSEVQLTFDLLD